MSKRKLIVGSVLAASLVAMAAVGVSAGEGGGYRCDKMERSEFGGRGGPGAGMENPGRHLLRGLDLTEEQRTKIEGIMEDQQSAMREKMKAMRQSKEELHAATFVKGFDAKKVRALADNQAKMMAEFEVARAEALNKVYNLLTPEQQKKFAERREERRRPPRD